MRSKTAIAGFFFTVSFVFNFSTVFAQWTLLSSGTPRHLNDVYFSTSTNGVAVGDSSTVLLTKDGGNSWLPIAGKFKESFQSALILEKDSILIAGGNYFDGNVYRTPNGGFDWDYTGQGISLAKSDTLLFALDNETIYKSFTRGADWKPSIIIIGSTTILEDLYFPGDSVGYAVGNISGFTQYSTYGYRSADYGENWKPLHETDFPNANAYTAGAFPHRDTGYIFTNAFENFLPGSKNQLVRITDFKLEEANLLVSWRFTAEVMNDSMPAFINDACFLNTQTGFAAGNDGSLYKTLDGGASWTVDYTGDEPLKALYFLDEKTGFAVGNNGTILRYEGPTTPVHRPAPTTALKLFPNPACSQLTLEAPGDEPAAFRLYNTAGQAVRQQTLQGRTTVSIAGLPAGLYVAEVVLPRQSLRSKVIIRSECR